MSRSWRIIVLSVLVFVLVANIAFFAFTTDAVYSNDWVTIKVFSNHYGAQYEYKGFAYFYEYISTFPGLANSISTINYVSAILSGQIVLSDYSVVNAILGVLTVIGSIGALLFSFVIDVVNMFIWLFGFFVPNWF